MSLIRVFAIPPPIHQFVGDGEPQTFINVDWFRDDSMPPELSRDQWETELRAFIAKKRYARPGRPLLVLGEIWSFTISYGAA